MSDGQMRTQWRPILKSAASSRLQSVREFLGSKDLRGSMPTRDGGLAQGQTTPQGQTWGQWAGQKIKRNGGDAGKVGVDSIALFPGWAARRYRKAESGELQEAFDVDIFISGYAVSRRPPELATRSQKAFMRLARGFASLPKLPGPDRDEQSDARPQLSPETEKLLSTIKLPPRPTEISEDYEIEEMEKEFRRAEISTQHVDPSLDPDLESLSTASSRTSSGASSPSISPRTSIISGSSTSSFSQPTPHHHNPARSVSEEIRRWHRNLEMRLQPFWSSALSARTIRLSIGTLAQHTDSPDSDASAYRHRRIEAPVTVQDVVTGADGSFQARVIVPWEDMCQHPGALHIAFGDTTQEHELLVEASLTPAASLAPPRSPGPRDLSFAQPQTPPFAHVPPPSTTKARVCITHADVRCISDIDDTVKFSNILSGARAVFHNVFVKDLHELVIPGMGSWYYDMFHRGVRFHYVSNGPFELLPVVNEFIQVSQLPPGSVKLKSYAGRSLFNGLLSAPATRKRAGIADILDAFPEARFFCVGDTGEQDLELYAQFARERPQQILGVFVRDASVYEDGAGAEGVPDPTGFNKLDSFFAPLEHPDQTPNPNRASLYGQDMAAIPMTDDIFSMPLEPPRRAWVENQATPRQDTWPPPPPPPVARKAANRLSMTSLKNDYFSSTSTASSSLRISTTPDALSDEPGTYSGPPSAHSSAAPPTTRKGHGSTGSGASMSDADKRRAELQARIYRARKHMPAHIPLRVFRAPEECVEAARILDKLHVGRSR